MATNKIKTKEPVVYYRKGKRHTRQSDGSVVVEEKRTSISRTSGRKIIRWVNIGYQDNE